MSAIGRLRTGSFPALERSVGFPARWTLAKGLNGNRWWKADGLL
jgi:hypothetical protein